MFAIVQLQDLAGQLYRPLIRCDRVRIKDSYTPTSAIRHWLRKLADRAYLDTLSKVSPRVKNSVQFAADSAKEFGSCTIGPSRRVKNLSQTAKAIWSKAV